MKHVYAHLSKVLVKVGDQVEKGSQVGNTGNTGKSTGPHLHYEVRKGGYGTDVDPTPYYKGTKSSSSKSKSGSSSYNGKYSKTINSAAKKYGVDVALVVAVADTESGIGKTSKNVMQVNGMNNSSPEASINKGTQMLADLLKITGGNKTLALAAYNMGPGVLDYFKKHGGYSVENMKAFSDIQKKKLGKKVYGDPYYVEKVLGKTEKVSKSNAEKAKSVDDARTESNNLKSDAAKIDDTLREKYMKLVEQGVKANEHAIDVADKKIKGKELDADKIGDKTSAAYRKNLNEQIDLHKVKKKNLNEEVAYIEKEIKTNKKLTVAQKEQLKDLLADKKNSVKEVDNTIRQKSAEVQQNFLDEKHENYDKKQAKDDDKLKSLEFDAQSIKDKTSKAYRDNLSQQVKIKQDKEKLLNEEIKFDQDQLKKNKKLTHEQKEDLEKRIADKKNSVKELRNTISQNDAEIQQNLLDETHGNYDKKQAKDDDKLRSLQLDAQAIDDETSKAYRDNLTKQVAIQQDKQNLLKKELKFDQDQLAKNKKLTEDQKADLEKRIADKQNGIKELDNIISDNQDTITASRHNERNEAFDKSMGDLDYSLAMAKKTEELTKEGSKKHVDAQKQIINITRQKIKANDDEAAAILKALRTEKMSDEEKAKMNERYRQLKLAAADYRVELEQLKQAERDEMADTLSKQKEANLEDIRKKYEEINKQLDDLVDKEDQFNAGEFTDSIDDLLYQLGVVSDKLKDQPIATDTVEQVHKSVEETKKSILDLNAELDKMIANNSKNATEMEAFIRSEIQKSNELTKQISAVNDAIRDAQYSNRLQEDSMQRQIDLKQKQLNQLDDEYNKEDRLKALRDLEDEMNKVQNDKRFSVIDANGKETLTYDKGKMDDLTKQRDELVKQYNREDVKQAMQDDIDRMQKNLEDTQRIHEAEIQQMQLYQQSLVTLQEKLNTDIAEKKDKLKEIQDGIITDTEKQWDDLITAVKDGTMTYSELMSSWYGKTIAEMRKNNADINAQVESIRQSYLSLAAMNADYEAEQKKAEDNAKAKAAADEKAKADAEEAARKKASAGVPTKTTTTTTTGTIGKGETIKKFHDGGIVGTGKQSKLTQIANKLFNIKPGETIIKSLVGELQIPPKNIPNLFTNIGNMMSSITPNFMIPVSSSADTNYNIESLTVQANNPKEMFTQLGLIARMNKN